MKSHFLELLFIATAVFVSGCREINIDEPSSELPVAGELVTFEATLAESGGAAQAAQAPGTKTGVIVDGKQGTVVWNPGDEISVFFVQGTAGGSRFSSTITSQSVSTSFTGEIVAFTGTLETPADQQMFWAVYPYDTANSCDGSYLYIPLAASQQSDAGTFSDGQWPTMAHSRGYNLGFYNICGGIAFTVAHDDIRSVTFRNIDGGSIAGTLKVGWNSEDRPEVSEITDGASEIVVTPSEGDAFVQGTRYYAVLPPVTMTEGIEVTYRTASAKATYTNTSSISIERNRYTALTARDQDLVFVPEAGPTPAGYELVTSEPDDWSGRYIIVDADKNYVFTGDTGTSNKETLAATDFDGDVITRNFSGCEFTISKSGSNYYLQHGGQYLYCDYGSNNSTGLKYSSSEHALKLEIQANGSYGFWMTESSKNQYLYYKSGTGSNTNCFKFGSSHNGNCVWLYKYHEASVPTTTFNLENPSLKSYLDAAETQYTDDNWSTETIVSDYCTNSSSNRKDIPAPVSLSWEAVSGSGDYTVSVYNDAACTELELSQSASGTSADIYNLIPGRDYWYKVTKNSAPVASGAFSTTGRRRMMKVSDSYSRNNANNCRDLGGLPTIDGKTLKYNLVFRGSNMNSTTTAERELLTGYMNVSMDIDLRGNDNGDLGARQVLSDVDYSNAKFNNWDDLQNAGKIRTTFTDLINTVTAGNTCYIHCYSGADRTGYICLLLEAVLGVSAKDCTIDYELTSFSTVGLRGRNGSKNSGDNVYITQGMNYISGYSKGSTFKEKAENILLDAGITAGQITALRNAMIEQ